MSKRSAEVKQLRLLSLDELKGRFESLQRQINDLKIRGRQIPKDLFEKLKELTAALHTNSQRYKRFHGKREEH